MQNLRSWLRRQTILGEFTSAVVRLDLKISVMATEDYRISWHQDSVKTLLELVKQNKFLWDQTNSMYHETELQQKAFNTIANKLKLQFPELSEINGACVQLKFKNIRTYFLDTYKRLKVYPVSSTWPLFKYASFLLESSEEIIPTNTMRWLSPETQPLHSPQPSSLPSDTDVMAPASYGKENVGEVDSSTRVQLSCSDDDGHLSQSDIQLSPSTRSNSLESLPPIFTMSGIVKQQETDASFEQFPHPWERKGNKRQASEKDNVTPSLKPDDSLVMDSQAGPLNADLDKTDEVVENAVCSQNINKKIKIEEEDDGNSLRELDRCLTRASYTSSLAAGIAQIVEAAANRLPYCKQVELLGKIYRAIKEVNDLTVSEDDT